jgi:hypothetical protein
MAVLKAIREFIVREVLKDSPKGVMTTLPNKDLVELNTQVIAQKLMQNGIDPTTLKNANQVENAIKLIEKRSKVDEGIKSTKSAKVFDLEGKEIDPKKGIMGGKQIPDDDLPPPGSRGGKDDIAAPVQSAEESLRDMFIAENRKNIAKIKNRKMVKDAVDNMSPGFVKGDRKYNAQLVAEDLAEKKFGKEFYDLDQKQQMDLYDEALDGLSVDPDEFAQGGRAGFADGTFGLDVLKLEDKALDRAITAFEYYKRTGGKKDFRSYLKSAGQRGDQFRAEGGRIGYKIGSIDKARRAFLKAAAGVTGGIAALKTGLFNIGKDTPKKVVKEIIKTPNAPGKPEWFDALVTRVIKEGDDVSKTMATKERQIVHRKKLDDETEVTVTQDLDDKVTRVDIDDPVRNVAAGDDPPTVSLQVTDEIVEEGGVRTKPKFEATENDYRNYATDPDGGYETEFIDNTVENTKDLTSDLTKVKSFATKKKPTMKEIVESKKRKDNVNYANERTVEYAADRGPQYDPSDYIDDMADDFASGGIARMLGE